MNSKCALIIYSIVLVKKYRSVAGSEPVNTRK